MMDLILSDEKMQTILHYIQFELISLCIADLISQIDFDNNTLMI